MNTITAILEPHADGTLHLPLPAGAPRGKVKVTATIESSDGLDATGTVEERMKLIQAAFQVLQEHGTFKTIADPVAWQREIRRDRALPGRD